MECSYGFSWSTMRLHAKCYCTQLQTARGVIWKPRNQSLYLLHMHLFTQLSFNVDSDRHVIGFRGPDRKTFQGFPSVNPGLKNKFWWRLALQDLFSYLYKHKFYELKMLSCTINFWGRVSIIFISPRIQTPLLKQIYFKLIHGTNSLNHFSKKTLSTW